MKLDKELTCVLEAVSCRRDRAFCTRCGWASGYCICDAHARRSISFALYHPAGRFTACLSETSP